MSVIVDTSVWSLALRRKLESSDPQVIKLADMLKQGQKILLLGVILQEVLQGIRSKKQFSIVKNHLDAFNMLTLEREDYIIAAELRNLCKIKGVQASSIDFQIAAACIQHDCFLLTCDQDFRYISNCCSLKLL